jgi:hypothetical protein
VFLGRAVLFAPIAELGLPVAVTGSAMSVGSLLAYASNFWAFRLNGALIDRHAAHPVDGYNRILALTVVVAAGGCVIALLLARAGARTGARRAARDRAASDATSS